MIGGGHVRRLSIGSIIEGSPCARVEKDKRVHSTIKGLKLVDRLAAMKKVNEKPSMPRIVEKASIASVSSVASHAFGSGRMDEARKGALKRQSLELGCLSAEGEDTSASCKPLSFRSATHSHR
jgi:serine/arginine repetitive matrix protein 2